MEQKMLDLTIEEFVKEQLFCGLHNHTEYSNLRLVDSNIVTEKIIDTAIELGHSGIAISDHECISSHIRLLQHMKSLRELKEKYIKVVSGEEFNSKSETEQKQTLKDTFGKKLALVEKMPQDFVLGLGNEIYLVDSLEEVRDNYQSGVTKFPHFVLQALDKEGHRQLRELSSQAWGNIFKNGAMERTPTTKAHLNQVIGTNKGHIVGSTACLGGELGLAVSKMIEGARKLSIHKQTLELMKQNKENASKLTDEVEVNKLRLYQNELKKCLVDVDKVQEDIQLAKRKVHIFINYCINVFGKENFFIEIQPSNMQDQIDFNRTAINIAKSYGLKWIITTDTHYLTKAHQKLHKNFLNSKEGDREVDDFYSSTYMMNLEEMWNYFSHYVSEIDFKTAVLTTLEIKNRIQEYDLHMAQQIPQRKLGDFEVKHIFKDYYKDNPYLEQCANSEFIQDRFFVHLVEEGFVDKKQIMNNTTVKRINDEIEQLIGISERMGQRMTSYYNLTELIIRILWSDKRGNSLVGVARGSVTGFYTCFLMGITQLNPIEWDLPYFRHISKTRPELPKQILGNQNLVNLAI